MAGAFCYIFSTSTFCGNIVQERELKLKYALNVMGCRTSTYWIGTFFFDLIMFYIVVIIYIILGISFDLVLIKDNVTTWLYLLLCFGYSVIFYCYSLSFMFNLSATSYKYSAWINMFIGFLVPFVCGILIHSPTLSVFLSLLFPFYALFNSYVTFINFVGIP